MSRLLLLTALISFFFLSSCRFNPNLQGKGTDFLQGVWSEDSIAYRNELIQYTAHEFKFSCDSFYVTMRTSAKANIYPDSCYNNGQWTEYAKGVYSIKNDSLWISGTFTKANFKQKISGCYRIGQYLETFIIKNRSATSIQLRSLKEHRPLQFTLKERITCIQKPIN
jgi:hypothetical protein